ncbi:hypothetical protein [Virgibacillus oceani]|uniref:hypothetical protein n=1 Tax=Virgibacillus oceani TaxID=1479511 RepID=UPI001665196F|nr:hypothetical protein [Virgibacillus oceani]
MININVKKLILYFGLMLFLFGCSPNSNSNSAKNDVQDVEYTKIANNSFVNQQKANKAKKILSKHDEITAIKAVNSDETLVVAIEVHQNKRFQLAAIRKKYAKELKEEFPKLHTELSTDKKIIFELNRLERQIKAKEISNKQIKKELKHITKLMKEQT